MSKPQIGIIGFGDFSKLMVRHLFPYADIIVATRQKNVKTTLPCRFVSTAEALARPIVIPSMPAQYLEKYFQKNARYLKPGSLVVDVCSVKARPVKTLKKVLPKNIEILATHPLFGPATTTKSLRGQRIMLHPARISETRYNAAKRFLQKYLHLRIIECTPEEHDKAMAYVLGLSHYVGRVAQIMGIPETELLTDSYEDLLDMKRVQGNDSWELFESIMHENPYALAVHKKFQKACAELDKRLGL